MSDYAGLIHKLFSYAKHGKVALVDYGHNEYDLAREAAAALATLVREREELEKVHAIVQRWNAPDLPEIIRLRRDICHRRRPVQPRRERA